MAVVGMDMGMVMSLVIGIGMGMSMSMDMIMGMEKYPHTWFPYNIPLAAATVPPTH